MDVRLAVWTAVVACVGGCSLAMTEVGYLEDGALSTDTSSVAADTATGSAEATDVATGDTAPTGDAVLVLGTVRATAAAQTRPFGTMDEVVLTPVVDAANRAVCVTVADVAFRDVVTISLVPVDAENRAQAIALPGSGVTFTVDYQGQAQGTPLSVSVGLVDDHGTVHVGSVDAPTVPGSAPAPYTVLWSAVQPLLDTGELVSRVDFRVVNQNSGALSGDLCIRDIAFVP